MQDYSHSNYCFRNLNEREVLYVTMEIDLYRCKLRKCRLVREESNVQARVKRDKYLTVHTSNQSHFSSAFIAPINLM